MEYSNGIFPLYANIKYLKIIWAKLIQFYTE